MHLQVEGWLLVVEEDPEADKENENEKEKGSNNNNNNNISSATNNKNKQKEVDTSTSEDDVSFSQYWCKTAYGFLFRWTDHVSYHVKCFCSTYML